MWVEAEIDDVLHDNHHTLFQTSCVIHTEPFDKHLRLRAA